MSSGWTPGQKTWMWAGAVAADEEEVVTWPGVVTAGTPGKNAWMAGDNSGVGWRGDDSAEPSIEEGSDLVEKAQEEGGG